MEGLETKPLHLGERGFGDQTPYNRRFFTSGPRTLARSGLGWGLRASALAPHEEWVGGGSTRDRDRTCA